ncbi:YlbD family protein [Paraliobacillus sp. PM-2]|uniref:YlbD family protein n=1 Tax=Paraliobacillus sp. PM-2 TaxID=1462524 RepID=UPI000B8758B3|nr:YlbD family protein [Paraliobacillus sp. PM-2]
MRNEQEQQDIEQFKAFVKRNPGMIKEVRNGEKKWQDFYEQWVLLGEDDPSWENYKQIDKKSNTKNSNSKSNKQWMKQMSEMVEKIDLNKVEGHINQLNGAITNIQSLIGQFQEVKKQIPSKTQHVPHRNPFQYYRD